MIPDMLGTILSCIIELERFDVGGVMSHSHISAIPPDKGKVTLTLYTLYLRTYSHVYPLHFIIRATSAVSMIPCYGFILALQLVMLAL